MTNIAVVVDDSGSRQAFALLGDSEQYYASFSDNMPKVVRILRARGFTHVVAIEKRTGVIADGKEWLAVVYGPKPGGIFTGFSVASVKFAAIDSIKEETNA